MNQVRQGTLNTFRQIHVDRLKMTKQLMKLVWRL